MSYSARALCDFVTIKGVCGKNCYGGRCHTHRNRASLALCRKQCGRGTSSRTGICNRCGCLQVSALHKMSRDTRKLDALLDALLGEVLEWDWGGGAGASEAAGVACP